MDPLSVLSLLGGSGGLGGAVAGALGGTKVKQSTQTSVTTQISTVLSNVLGSGSAPASSAPQTSSTSQAAPESNSFPVYGANTVSDPAGAIASITGSAGNPLSGISSNTIFIGAAVLGVVALVFGLRGK